MAKKRMGRNKIKCANYRAVRAIPNKLRKLHRHLKVHINDSCAQTALQRVVK